uniref:Histone deacetylase glutamine rich N-terminal domain-containing protein n=1 Tax=Scylla olivacea TaxID=85551 RepID=A0A0P4VWY0_SCYOL
MPQNLDKLPASHVMEINTSYGGPLVKKEVGSPPLGSPQLPPCSASSELTEMANDPATFEQHLLQLKQDQQLQQELLLQQYQLQQQQLTEQHQKQLQQHIKLQQNLLYHQFQQEHQRLLEQQENELRSQLKVSGSRCGGQAASWTLPNTTRRGATHLHYYVIPIIMFLSLLLLLCGLLRLCFVFCVLLFWYLQDS